MERLPEEQEYREGTEQVAPAHFAPLKLPSSSGGERDLGFLLDIPVTVVAEIGQARMPLRDLLALEVNSVIELNKFTGDPVDILANNRPIARGEVVVFGEKFAVRITEFLEPGRGAPEA